MKGGITVPRRKPLVAFYWRRGALAAWRSLIRAAWRSLLLAEGGAAPLMQTCSP